MSVKRTTVAELILILAENFSPLDEIDVSLTSTLVIAPATPVTPSAEKPKKNIFSISPLGDPGNVEVGDLVYFDYANPGNGPVERVGFVLKDEYGRFLLEDLSVGGKPRWFNHVFIEDIFLLS